MELMQLQMLVALAEEGSLQKAAGRVFRTAPAVSIAISKLEKEIGAKLLDRARGQAFRPTAAGEVLVDYARRSAVTSRGSSRRSRGSAERRARPVANRCESEHGRVFAATTYQGRFQKQYPGVKLKVIIGYSDAVLAALKRQELDVALVAGQPQDGELRGHLLMRDRLIAVMSPRNPLAAHQSLRIQDLAAEPLIVLTATSELRERVTETFQRFRVPLNVQVETGTLESIKRMAARDMGVGIVPRMCVQPEETNIDLAAKTIEEFREERMLWMVCRRTAMLSPACRAFMKVTKSEVIALSNDGNRNTPPLSSKRKPKRSNSST